ncbi:glycosyltransferase [Chloroflexota bacterium]
MNRVSTREVKLVDYAGIVPEDLMVEVNRLAERLRGLRVMHVNATPVGGGVAEILKSLVPLMRSVGLDADWYAIEPDESFFQVSKALHHCLQGDNNVPGRDEIGLYLSHNEKAACALGTKGVSADVWIVHDVQLLPLLRYLGNGSIGAWVCHIDATEPAESLKELLLPYMMGYQRVVVSAPEYQLDGLDPAKLLTFPPAIDPLVPKNVPLPTHQARELLGRLGIDPARPIVCQVSRFDRWKDHWGVVDAYRLAKEEIPGLQLALVGVMSALDDPDALEVLTSIQDYAGGDPDIHLFSNALVVGDQEINAFQSGCDVIVQKSTREGFGLTVTEAMWKRTPVVAGDCGGIRLQICDGETGFLVADVPSCAERIVTLLKDPALARRIGDAGRESVRRNYLMPRLLRDYLKLVTILAASEEPVSTASC